MFPVKVTTPTGLKFAMLTEAPGAFRVRLPEIDAIVFASSTPIVMLSMCAAPNLLVELPRSAPWSVSERSDWLTVATPTITKSLLIVVDP